MKSTKGLAVAMLIGLSGCASITGSEMQSVALTATDSQGQLVDKAECELQNDKGHWTAKTPGFVTIRRSAEDLSVTCRKEGLVDGVLRAVSRAAGRMFGNIVFGGGIGALIDHNKGNGYNYPDSLPVKMGASTIVDRDAQDVTSRRQSSGQSQSNVLAGCDNGVRC